MDDPRPLTCLALLLASCGAAPSAPSEHPTSGAEAHVSVQARACPMASAVHYASWWIPSASEMQYQGPGLPTTGYWSLPIGYRLVEDGAPEPGPVLPEALGSFGLDALPPDLFVLRAGVPACRAHVAGYVAELIEDGVANVRVSALVTDCPASAWRTIGWATEADPAGCALVVPSMVGQTDLVEDQTSTRMPSPIPPVPAPYAAAIPPAECAPPCGTLWRIVAADGPTDVADVWIDHITPGTPEEACDWTEIASTPGLYVVGPDGVAHAMPYPQDDGYERPMTLAGILVDGAGTEVVLLTTNDAWGAFELTASGTLGEGRLVQMFVPNEEDGEYRSLAPYCGP